MTTLRIQTHATPQAIEAFKTLLLSIDPEAVILEDSLSPSDTQELHRIYTKYQTNTLKTHSATQTKTIMEQKGIKW